MSNFNRLYAILNSHSGGTENKKCVLIFLSKNLSRFLNVRESSSHVRQRGFARACLTPDRQKRGGEHLVRREHFKKKQKNHWENKRYVNNFFFAQESFSGFTISLRGNIEMPCTTPTLNALVFLKMFLGWLLVMHSPLRAPSLFP